MPRATKTMKDNAINVNAEIEKPTENLKNVVRNSGTSKSPNNEKISKSKKLTPVNILYATSLILNGSSILVYLTSQSILPLVLGIGLLSSALAFILDMNLNKVEPRLMNIAYGIAKCGSETEQLSLINAYKDNKDKYRMLLGVGVKGPSAAYMLSKYGSEEVQLALIEKDTSFLGIHDILGIGKGTKYSVAHSLAVYGTNTVKMKLVEKGLDVLKIKQRVHDLDGVEQGYTTVAYEIVKNSSEAVQLALIEKGGRKLLRMCGAYFITSETVYKHKYVQDDYGFGPSGPAYAVSYSYQIFSRDSCTIEDALRIHGFEAVHLALRKKLS